MPATLERSRVSTVSLKLDTSCRERLKTLADSKKRSAHYLMKEAIERYLSIEESQQALLQSIDDSVAHYEATGLHISHTEVRDWIGALKTDRNAKLAPCHL